MEINFDDQDTWDLFKSGQTKGIFQLESNLGKSWSKRVAPTNIRELSDLIAIIRPGTLQSMYEGKSMTQHYVDRKNGKEPVEFIHPALEPILGKTFGVLVYQEQAMKIASELAGFSLQEADDLRKAIGKKKADLMAKVKVKFINGCAEKGVVDNESAESIFDWIEKSARYSFNASHSVSYAFNAYRSAFRKAHALKSFFTGTLEFACEKQDTHEEIYELVSDIRNYVLDIRLPTIDVSPANFKLIDDIIYFGVKNIKSLTGVRGDEVMVAIATFKEESSDKSWINILLNLGNCATPTMMKALCAIGFFSTKDTKVTRNKTLYDFEIYNKLTVKEQEWLRTNYKTGKWNNLIDALRSLAPRKIDGGGTNTESRRQRVLNEIELLVDPPYELSDEPSWIIAQEEKYMGCPVSYAKIDAADSSESNTSCRDITTGKIGENLVMAVNLARIAKHTIKKGDNKGRQMSFLTIEDSSGSMDNVVMFADETSVYGHYLQQGANVLLIGGVKDKDSSYVIRKICEI